VTAAAPVKDRRPSEVDSWALVEAIKQGDTARFGALYERYAPILRRYFRARGFDFPTADDLTSETCLRAFRAIRSLSYQRKDVLAWFMVIARNLAIDHLKSAHRRHEVCVGDLPDVSVLTSDPERTIMARAELDALLPSLRSLSDEQRQCLVLRRIFGQSVEETAASMNRSQGAVRALLHRAARSLNESRVT
jgi:RNA polymerase sigma-70 factor (ECF subfamily)